MKYKLHKDTGDLKKYINILLMEDYLNGLENYFMPDGSLKKLHIVPGSGQKITITCLAMAGYFPILIEEIYDKSTY